MPATDGPTGLRPTPPSPSRDVKGTDGGEDRRARRQRGQRHRGVLGQRVRRDVRRRIHPRRGADLLGRRRIRRPSSAATDTYGLVNAGVLLRRQHHRLGPRRAAAVAARRRTATWASRWCWPTSTATPSSTRPAWPRRAPRRWSAEQQADCLAGVYMRWVAEGNSPRFTLSTGDGLNNVLAAMIAFRDPLLTEGDPEVGVDEHGSAFERVSAFQFGFTDGAVGVRGDRPAGDRPAPRRPARAAARGPDRRTAGHRGVGAVDRRRDGHPVLAGQPAAAELRGVRRPGLPGRQAEPAGVVLPGHQHDRRRPGRAAR